MTVDTLLESEPILGSKSQKIGMVCAKLPVDTLLGPDMVSLSVHYGHASEGPYIRCLKSSPFWVQKGKKKSGFFGAKVPVDTLL